MTYHDDPNRGHRVVRDNKMGWILGLLAVIAVIGLIIWSLSDNNRTTAGTGAGNTGATSGGATKSAPAPAPANPSPGTPARP